jgi:hypothetical protein
MKQFYKTVDLRSREAMTDFLTDHFRYNTANTPYATSYACNIKIHSVGLDCATREKLYDLVQTDGFHDELRFLFDEFAETYAYRWQIGINGRSGGYMVLYRGGQKPSEYKSYCRKCGQRNFTSVNENSNICGVCREPARVDYTTPPMETFTYPGKSVDMYEDFDYWDIVKLRERVKLIQEFDHVADAVVAMAADMTNAYAVKDEIYYTPQTRKVLVPVGG